jgi:hypothetical protein
MLEFFSFYNIYQKNWNAMLIKKFTIELMYYFVFTKVLNFFGKV